MSAGSRKNQERKVNFMSRKFVSIAVCAAIVLSGCGGGGGSGASDKNQVIESGMLMQSDSFSFANFGASATDLNFDETDLVAMFGNSDGVCIEPQTAPPDAQNLGISGENYIEALFVFESLE